MASKKGDSSPTLVLTPKRRVHLIVGHLYVSTWLVSLQVSDNTMVVWQSVCLMPGILAEAETQFIAGCAPIQSRRDFI